MKYKILFFVLLAFFAGSLVSNGQENFVYPGDAWDYEEKTACNPYGELNSFIIERLNTTGLLIIKGGKISFEYGDTEEISYLASARKSILSMMYGKYVANGTINLDSSLEDLNIDDVNSLTAEEKKATVDQIINARSGIYLPAANAGSAPNMPKRGQYQPGTHFYYNNWDFNVAGTIFEQTTGKGIYEAFQEDIATPLNFQDFVLADHRRTGNEKMSSHLAYHFLLSTRDMARLGYLMLRKGKWNDTQIIPEQWIEKTTTNVSDTDEYGMFKGYSYMWWRYENPEYELLEGAYSAAGAFGQFITVIPKLDMVIAHKTKSAYERVTSVDDYDQFVLKLLEGIARLETAKGNINTDDYLGGYTDNSRQGQPMPIEIYSEDDAIMLKAPMFPKPMKVTFCNEDYAFMSDLRMRQLDLHFEKNDDGSVKGFRVRNVFIEKN